LYNIRAENIVDGNQLAIVSVLHIIRAQYEKNEIEKESNKCFYNFSFDDTDRTQNDFSHNSDSLVETQELGSLLLSLISQKKTTPELEEQTHLKNHKEKCKLIKTWCQEKLQIFSKSLPSNLEDIQKLFYEFDEYTNKEKEKKSKEVQDLQQVSWKLGKLAGTETAAEDFREVALLWTALLRKEEEWEEKLNHAILKYTEKDYCPQKSIRNTSKEAGVISEKLESMSLYDQDCRLMKSREETIKNVPLAKTSEQEATNSLNKACDRFDEKLSDILKSLEIRVLSFAEVKKNISKSLEELKILKGDISCIAEGLKGSLEEEFFKEKTKKFAHKYDHFKQLMAEKKTLVQLHEEIFTVYRTFWSNKQSVLILMQNFNRKDVNEHFSEFKNCHNEFESLKLYNLLRTI